MNELTLWQSASGVTAQMTVSVGGLSPTTLEVTDRTPGETQLRASQPPNTGTANWREAYPEWSSYIRDKRDEDTAVEYQRYVSLTFEWIESNRGKSDLCGITWQDLEAYRRSWNAARRAKTGKDLKPSTENLWIAAIQSFYQHAIVRLDYDLRGVRNIGRKLERHSIEEVRRTEQHRTPVPRDLMQRVVDAAESHGDHAFALALRFQWATICRIEDVWSLRPDQLELKERPTVSYKASSKHGYDVVKPLDKRTSARLKGLLEMKISATEPVFHPEGQSKEAFDKWYNYRFRLHAAFVGIESRVDSHTVRVSANQYGEEIDAPDKFLRLQGVWVLQDAKTRAYDSKTIEKYREWVEKLALD